MAKSTAHIVAMTGSYFRGDSVPVLLPKGLKEAHHQLDLAIERCYRLKPFENDVERLEYLFKMYEEMTTKNSLFAKEKKTKKVK